MRTGDVSTLSAWQMDVDCALLSTLWHLPLVIVALAESRRSTLPLRYEASLQKPFSSYFYGDAAPAGYNKSLVLSLSLQ